MSINHGYRALSVAVLSSLLLAGCAAEQSMNGSYVPLPGRTSMAIIEVAALRVSGSDLQLLAADGTPLDGRRFSDGAEAVVGLISDGLETEPTVSDEEAQCAAAHTEYSWPGISLAAFTGSADFVLTLSAATSGDVRLETAGGYAPGDDVSAFVETLPADRVGRTPGPDLFVAFDVVSTTTQGEYTSPVGAVGYLPDGAILQTILAPGEWSSFLC